MAIGKLVLIVYGAFLILGGFMGFKAGSKVSLIMGLVSGALILLSAYLVSGQPIVGFSMATVVSGFLSITFLMRFIKTQKIMPSGMLLAVSVLVLCFCISSYFKLKQTGN